MSSVCCASCMNQMHSTVLLTRTFLVNKEAPAILSIQHRRLAGMPTRYVLLFRLSVCVLLTQRRDTGPCFGLRCHLANTPAAYGRWRFRLGLFDQAARRKLKPSYDCFVTRTLPACAFTQATLGVAVHVNCSLGCWKDLAGSALTGVRGLAV